MAAQSVLPIAGTVGQSAEFTLVTPTMVWVHGGAGTVVIGIKGSDGVFSGIVDMEAGGASRCGMLPVGDYKVTRTSGVCGFQRAA